MKREIRAGTLVGFAGPGAVVDIGNESFIVPPIYQWHRNALQRLDLPRLSGRLGRALRAVEGSRSTLPAQRFPASLFCESCRNLIHWKTQMEEKGKAPRCPRCERRGTLVPMRFVLACENGHLQDFPWHLWAHSGDFGDRDCTGRSRLKFEVRASGGETGLASLQVRCTECGSRRDLGDITSRREIGRLLHRCHGRHPWHRQSEECDAKPEVLQRGATNLHYPVTLSALDIPSLSEEDDTAAYRDLVQGHDKYSRLRELVAAGGSETEELRQILTEMIASGTGVRQEVVSRIAEEKTDGRDSSEAREHVLDQDCLLQEEWHTFSGALERGSLRSRTFIAETESANMGLPRWASSLIDGILLIHRLREVSVFTGFQRVRPGAGSARVAADPRGSEDWLPAAERFGEGVLFRISSSVLRQWEASLPAEQKSHIETLEAQRVAEEYWFLPPVTPTLIAVHSLSHLLLRRITFECGYSSSSLNERLYIDPVTGHAGILIYTGDGDSEGSLGGLVRQGRNDRIGQTLHDAVEEARWCSSDPVCSETSGQGLGGFNRAACHACTLVSETSCTMANTLLDRRLLLDSEVGLINFAESTR